MVKSSLNDLFRILKLIYFRADIVNETGRKINTDNQKHAGDCTPAHNKQKQDQ